jgi:hypothetical protein
MGARCTLHFLGGGRVVDPAELSLFCTLSFALVLTPSSRSLPAEPTWRRFVYRARGDMIFFVLGFFPSVINGISLVYPVCAAGARTALHGMISSGYIYHHQQHFPSLLINQYHPKTVSNLKKT